MTETKVSVQDSGSVQVQQCPDVSRCPLFLLGGGVLLPIGPYPGTQSLLDYIIEFYKGIYCRIEEELVFV